jgi:hypothetical protein
MIPRTKTDNQIENKVKSSSVWITVKKIFELAIRILIDK